MMVPILVALVLFGGLLAAYELIRRFRWVAFGVFFLVPLGLLPLWLGSQIGEWFRWVKLISVIFAGIWVWFVRFTPWGRARASQGLIVVILAGNILEACLQDAQTGALWNWLNAAAGLASILAMRGWKSIGPSELPGREMLWKGLDLPWIGAYTLWNWTFVYFNFPGYVLIHAAVLLTPIVANFVVRGTWAQARAYSLALWMMLEFSAPLWAASVSAQPARPEVVALVLGGASLGANLVVLVRRLVLDQTPKDRPV